MLLHEHHTAVPNNDLRTVYESSDMLGLGLPSRCSTTCVKGTQDLIVWVTQENTKINYNLYPTTMSDFK